MVSTERQIGALRSRGPTAGCRDHCRQDEREAHDENRHSGRRRQHHGEEPHDDPEGKQDFLTGRHAHIVPDAEPAWAAPTGTYALMPRFPIRAR
jgi:hypothetical protein